MSRKRTTEAVQRGDIFSTVGKGDFSTKPRPGLIVQSNAFNAHHPAFTVCPITTHLTGDGLYRIAIAGDETTGLLDDSEIEIDRVQAIWRHRIRQHIGRAPDDIMARVDEAFRRWLDL